MSFLNRSLKTLRYLTRSGLSRQVNACCFNRLCYVVIPFLVLKRYKEPDEGIDVKFAQLDMVLMFDKMVP